MPNKTKPKKPATPRTRVTQNNAPSGYKALEQAIQNASMLERSMMGRRLGLQYNGERNLYDAFGYIEQPGYADYRGFFDRMGIATRIVEMFPNDTWGNPPVLVDGTSRSDIDEGQTQFIQDWNMLCQKVGMWQMMREADILASIGKWSVLFLGAPGNYNEPAGDGGIAFLMTYGEQSSVPQTWIQDVLSEKYGMPETYQIMFASPGEPSTLLTENNNPVHHTRVIHISENRLGTRYTGRPRLQSVLNNLFDLEKIVGGASEAVWLTLFKGLILTAREGYSLPVEGTPESDALIKKMNLMINKIQRYAAFENVDLKDLGVDEIKVRETFDIDIEAVCIAQDIPTRIFKGNQEGERASNADMLSWNRTIKRRQILHAEPEFIDPMIRWGIVHKVIAPPESGKWRWEWKPVFSPTQIEESQIMLAVAQAANTLKPGFGETVVSENELRGIIHMPIQQVQELPADPDAEAIPVDVKSTQKPQLQPVTK